MEGRQVASPAMVDSGREATQSERSHKADRHQSEGNERKTISSASGHKRTVSGGLLSRLPFLRSTSEVKAISPSVGSANGATSVPGATMGTAEGPSTSAAGPGATARPSSTTMSQGVKNRSRKGSLRKTALLGGGRLRSTAEKRMQMETDSLKPEDASSKASSEAESSPVPASPSDSDDHPTPRPSYEENKTFTSATGGDNIAWTQSRDMERSERSNTSDESLPLPAPGVLARKSIAGDMSTTDEDESSKYSSSLLSAPSASSAASSILKKHVAGGSFSPLDLSTLQRRRSGHRPRAKSPLAALPIEPVAAPPEEWDYSETEWWGWAILVLTWAVFVMGMGSCFGVWSWAWDVGETPYAPPELEDDPTLPIVGYYPALIILTGVMAWVWVVVAWVGMKYFRHAKMAGDV